MTARILHAPTNVAGIAGLLARAQRDLGRDATAVEYVDHPYRFPVDRSLGVIRRGPRAAQAVAVGRFALEALRRYDVFHLYFGHSLFPYPYPDLPLLRALGKRIVFHFCGCDIRDRAANLRTYRLSVCTECTEPVCLERHRVKPRPGDLVFVSTPDLLEFVPGAKLLPGPIDRRRWRPLPPRERPPSAADPIRLLHAPSKPALKGTTYVVAAVERLQARGVPVELLLLENTTSDEVLRASERADLAVDQLLAGGYGTVAVEMMARGLPVVCRIRADLRAHYPADLPIVSAEPDGVEDTIGMLIEDERLRRELGRRGVEYVRRHHDMHVVAGRALSEYGAA